MACSTEPMTGFFRTGICDTCAEDVGRHTVCAEMTEDFLAYSKLVGNDLSTPIPEFGFPGLKPGDFWCVCMSRWIQALHAGKAPRLKLDACHVSLLEFIDKEVLMEYSVSRI
jgi:uncharacterized protein (DUF2237 family)